MPSEMETVLRGVARITGKAVAYSPEFMERVLRESGLLRLLEVAQRQRDRGIGTWASPFDEEWDAALAEMKEKMSR